VEGRFRNLFESYCAWFSISRVKKAIQIQASVVKSFESLANGLVYGAPDMFICCIQYPIMISTSRRQLKIARTLLLTKDETSLSV
jgi:hypothetical protein